MKEETSEKRKESKDSRSSQGFMFCPRCGHTVAGEYTNAFCKKCGYRFCPSCNE